MIPDANRGAAIGQRFDFGDDFDTIDPRAHGRTLTRDDLDVELLTVARPFELHRLPHNSNPASSVHGERTELPLASLRAPYGAAVPPARPPPIIPSETNAAAISAVVR